MLGEVAAQQAVLHVVEGIEEPADREPRPLALEREDVIIINQFLSEQDGDWAKDVLMQTRRALYELRTGVLPGWTAESEKVWRGATTDKPPDDVRPADPGPE